MVEAIHIRAAQPVQAGECPEAVIGALGYSSRCGYNWFAMYRGGGWEAFEAKRSLGRPRKPRATDIRWVCRTVVACNPLQLSLPFALRTRSTMASPILKRTEVRLSLVAVGRLLGPLELTCERLLWSAYQQAGAWAQQWL